jgi:hypothetical protein
LDLNKNLVFPGQLPVDREAIICYLYFITWGCSSDGRAHDWQS